MSISPQTQDADRTRVKGGEVSCDDTCWVELGTGNIAKQWGVLRHSVLALELTWTSLIRAPHRVPRGRTRDVRETKRSRKELGSGGLQRLTQASKCVNGTALLYIPQIERQKQSQ